jgi:hypothetical protein
MTLCIAALAVGLPALAGLIFWAAEPSVRRGIRDGGCG